MNRPSARLFRDPDRAAIGAGGSVLCIGAFDGLHLGHRALVRRAVARARQLQCEAVALSFEPLPREFFARDLPPARLTAPRAKVEGLLALGVDRVGLLRFDARMAAMTARQFIERVLVDVLRAREVWVGPGFAFGQGRQGDLALLQAVGAAHGFAAHAIEPVLLDGQRVSSSDVRERLARGDLVGAGRQLGRPFAMSGRVVRGRQLGRTLGFPTANLRCGRLRPALHGIFATRVHADGCNGWPSVASLGTRPMVDGVEPLLEVHLLDFDGDLYGRRIEVEFVARLRDEQRFADLPAMTAQMQRDAEQARAILGLQETKRGVMA
ncbi:MAG: bifunctional riboflavin kinase/FAD synthetase [Proteobacteria bacterium]|nr:bifunctional riboflavin kinase/FAD synthetase [Pseudomonadota bacterium]MBS0464255.1 bifunctional riboflavin kinase/FAD synthetase [Pseudomonadota bacterium]